MTDFILGKKCILFPINEKDTEFFIKLYRENEEHMGIFAKGLTDEQLTETVSSLVKSKSIKVWVALTRMGKASQKIGCLFLTDITPYSANVHGFVDNHYLKDLVKQMEIKYTYTEDCSNTLINYCFKELGLERLSAVIRKPNTLSYRLSRKVGFKPEGVLRKAIKDGDNFIDLIVLSILKEERLLSDTEAKPQGVEV